MVDNKRYENNRVMLIGATPLVKTFKLIPVVDSYNGSHNGL